MTVFSIAGWVLIFLFILPVFTGQVVNIGNITGLAAGAFLISVSRSAKMLHQGWVITVFAILAVCIAAAIRLSHGMLAACRKKPSGKETLLILGCEVIGEKPSLMLEERLLAAYTYLCRYPQASVICSGGKGKKEMISEAEAMRQWLIAHGIAESRIYLEDHSETTLQNIRCTKRILETEGLMKEIAVCSNEFHLYRAFLFAKEEGLSCSGVPAKTAWWLFPTFYVRELYALLYLMIRRHF